MAKRERDCEAKDRGNLVTAGLLAMDAIALQSTSRFATLQDASSGERGLVFGDNVRYRLPNSEN